MSPACKYSLMNDDERHRVRWYAYFKIMKPKEAIEHVFDFYTMPRRKLEQEKAELPNGNDAIVILRER